MGRMLTNLVAAGLVTKLDGDDGRLEKMSRAVSRLVSAMTENRNLLIPAILTGLNANSSVQDAMILRAEQALQAEWPTMSSVHTDRPINLYRSLLLAACAEMQDTTSGAILWNTAADTYLYSSLGREACDVRAMLSDMATLAELAAASSAPRPKTIKPTVMPASKDDDTAEGEEYQVDRGAFEREIFAAFGPSNSSGQGLPNSNQNWPNSGQAWSYHAAPRLQVAISDQLDGLAEDTAVQLEALEGRVNGGIAALEKKVSQAVAQAAEGLTADRLRLDVLWWFEALYSSTQKCSYRELSKELATIVMAYDLLAIVPGVMPASVAHLMAEGVNRLSGASFDNKHSIDYLLKSLSTQRSRLPDDWLKAAQLPAPDCRLSLRDVVVKVLTDGSADITALLDRAGIPQDMEWSLPEFGRAVLRQEHAVRLAATELPASRK